MQIVSEEKALDPANAYATRRPTGEVANRAFSVRQGWTMLLVLTLLNILLSLDRTIAQLIAEPIKHEFHLSDSEIGALLGIAFGIPYGIFGLALGPLIDRVSRSRYLAVALSIWSGMTFVMGLSAGFLVMILARAGLGAAEAGASPAAMSLLGDIFPPNRRSTAVGIFKIGLPLGTLLASIITGYVVADHGWRAAFLFAGAPGFLVAILMLVGTAEPRRGAMEPGTAAVVPTPYREALRFVLRNARVTPFVLAFLLWMFGSSAFAAFSAAFLQRSHGLSLKDVGFYYGLGSVLGIVSPVIVGVAADRITGAGGRRIFLFLAAIVMVVGGSAIAALIAPGRGAAIAALLLWQFSSVGLAAPCLGVVISLTPVGMRGSVLSIVSVANMCVGFGVGPFFVGVVSDLIGGPNSLNEALVAVMALTTLASAGLFCLAGRNVVRHAAAMR